jgi:hypothetical protein
MLADMTLLIPAIILDLSPGYQLPRSVLYYLQRDVQLGGK